ncbi:SDR family NAD(P)-dependent oxidoreductase [Kutzneria albida]|uniref:Short-chain dehydrogenase/reductase SDR n=1 Tax=Kutzneria albida DSM 43870 TaxID=1449976 RepID=W5WGA9_9PSEU|nr:SDR family NAD(P)-dependent oxidoreductase [Kutzneria albida]AHH99785.1 hypothetical protein KALB_6426 [Kutzneria albida DSM 43870]
MAELDGAVAVVTGATGTVGAGIARVLAARGARVVVHHRDSAEAAEALAAEVGGVAAMGDLREPGQVEGVLHAAVEAFGRLDVLVNNAGVQPVTALPELTLPQWREVFAGNADTTFLASSAAARLMGPLGGGSIISIASIEGTSPAVGHAHYAASKAAVLAHTKAAAVEYGPMRIRVNAVSPGLIARPGIEQQWPEGVDRWRRSAPLTRLGSPRDVGEACAFLASPRASWITGQNLVVDGGVSARAAW